MDIALEQVLGDEDVQDLLDRRMQVAIENSIDIATHIVSALGLSRKEHASDIFLLLGKHKIITKELAQKLVGAVGLRNILVHEYAEVDYRLAYSDLDQKLGDLKEFASVVIDFLEKNAD